jgi:hypothetical protein
VTIVKEFFLKFEFSSHNGTVRFLNQESKVTTDSNKNVQQLVLCMCSGPACICMYVPAAAIASFRPQLIRRHEFCSTHFVRQIFFDTFCSTDFVRQILFEKVIFLLFQTLILLSDHLCMFVLYMYALVISRFRWRRYH